MPVCLHFESILLPFQTQIPKMCGNGIIESCEEFDCGSSQVY